MRLSSVRPVVVALMAIGLGLSGSESNAAGPAAAQQTVAQVNSALTDASVGFHRWGGGWGHRGWGWGGGWRGGWGGGGWGYGGWGGGWGNRGFGWGGSPWVGYGGFGYVNPVIYSYSYPVYPVVRYRVPSYYYGCSYTLPAQSCCADTTSYVSPSYSVSNNSYPSQPVTIASQSYSTPSVSMTTGNLSPSYASPIRQARNLNSSTVASYGHANTGLYTPTKSTTTADSTLSAVRRLSPTSRSVPFSTSAPVAAPYPQPPVEYATPTPPTTRAPVASRSFIKMHSGTPASASAPPPKVSQVKFDSLAYSTALAHNGATHSAYAPTSHNTYSAITPLASRINYGLTW